MISRNMSVNEEVDSQQPQEFLCSLPFDRIQSNLVNAHQLQ